MSEQQEQNGSQPLDDDETTPEALRARLVQNLRISGTLTDEAVAKAMARVPRHLFLPAVPINKAYADEAIPTHWDDQIAVSSASQPAIVAIMLQQLQLASGMRVLEIGAGTGYNAALLAELVGPTGSVTTLDIDDEIVAEALDHLTSAGYSQVQAIATDGAAGWPDGAPYDRIMLTVGASDITPAWFAQLREDGLLVLPLWLGGVELSVAFRKRGDVLISESQTPCGFMRLRGEEAGSEQWVTLPKGRKLFAEHAAELAGPVVRLLSQRPRIRIWTHLKPPTFFQYLSLHGYRLVAIYNDQRPQRPGRRTVGRWGIYLDQSEDTEDTGSPSMAIFASSVSLLLSFGGPAAERALEEEFTRWRRSGLLPVERWHIIARPYDKTTAMPAESDLQVARRHFVFSITMNSLESKPTSGVESSQES